MDLIQIHNSQKSAQQHFFLLRLFVPPPLILLPPTAVVTSEELPIAFTATELNRSYVINMFITVMFLPYFALTSFNIAPTFEAYSFTSA